MFPRTVSPTAAWTHWHDLGLIIFLIDVSDAALIQIKGPSPGIGEFVALTTNCAPRAESSCEGRNGKPLARRSYETGHTRHSHVRWRSGAEGICAQPDVLLLQQRRELRCIPEGRGRLLRKVRPQ